jgi:hypothetical protein
LHIEDLQIYQPKDETLNALMREGTHTLLRRASECALLRAAMFVATPF